MDVVDVPDVSARWYLVVVGVAVRSPGIVRGLGGFLTDALIVVFALLFAFLWWRVRELRPRLVVGTGLVVVAYVVSEVVKAVWRVDRPCRVLGDVPTIVACPEVGDWSFPSNHAVVAGAAAVVLLWCGWRWGSVAVGVALVAAGSRVFVGAHYPHDVVAGLVLGALVAAPLPLLVRPRRG